MSTGPAKVKKKKIADPGLGFVLDLSDPSIPNPLPNLQVAVSIAGFSANVAINNPVADREVVFVIPFGDTAYAGQIGQALGYAIVAIYIADLETGRSVTLYDNTMDGSTLIAQGGRFKLNLQRSFLLPVTYATTVDPDSIIPGMINTGDHLTSPNGRYLCQLEPDGDLTLYDRQIEGAASVSLHIAPNNTVPAGTKYFGVLTMGTSGGIWSFYQGSFEQNPLPATPYFTFSANSPQGQYLALSDSGVVGFFDNINGTGTPFGVVMQANP